MPSSGDDMQEPSGKICWGMFAVEIQHHICAQLCATERGSRRALAALCRTSSGLRAIAQPMLYRHITCFCRADYLIQTLGSRPDLAAYAKRYTQLSYVGNTECIIDDKSAKLGYIARDLLMNDSDDPELEEAKLGNHLWAGSFINDLVLALMPNLETASLTVEQNHNDPETAYSYLARRSQRLGKGPLFPKLRHLTFSTDPHEHWGYDMSIEGIRVMLEQAPNLRQLTFVQSRGFDTDALAERGVSMKNYRRLPSLHSLEFNDSAFDADCEDNFILIRHIINTSPHLRHFRFQSQSAWIGEDVSMERMGSALIRCLKPREDTLESLDIDLTQHSNFYAGGGYLRDDLHSHPLAGFTRLATLNVDEGFICPGRHGQETSHLEWPCMLDAVPQSLETLRMRVFQESRAWTALCELAVQVTSGRFPKLKRVSVHAIKRKQSSAYNQANTSVRRMFSAHVLEKEKELRRAFENLPIQVTVVVRGFFHHGTYRWR
ncbi:hypothetical protein S7711_11008 [Stachybotrys chartarum IBT 7711]|uniref:F-box domain-containing protein n=1 Tax=Stachybotrys chartarum (strain CBS 109288 / IBT 7711) TaxID=1280523 RepID=A0A084B673_STACB|nr:hypothetical protein S7711_11008 [Stachybotrys chartarum IBT 7711]